MVTDGRLREPDGLDQVTDTGLAAIASHDQAEELKPDRVCDRLQNARETLGVDAGEWCCRQWRSALGIVIDRREDIRV
ncbi:hypothetical protein [Frankia sp. AgB1.8]|uniref:hypothetical protein n=1 Tax=Frankia sp. AgB1.8 TaxID=2792839 RepID=UPI0027DACE67|nr:hypothetical protein [Frankia sp. AgB1.8]